MPARLTRRNLIGKSIAAGAVAAIASFVPTRELRRRALADPPSGGQCCSDSSQCTFVGLFAWCDGWGPDCCPNQITCYAIWWYVPGGWTEGCPLCCYSGCGPCDGRSLGACPPCQ